MLFRTWMWPLLLAGCGTLTYYEKGARKDDSTDAGDDDDDDDDNGDTTPPGDDDDTTPPGDDDDTTPPGDDDDDTTPTTTACVYPSASVTAATAAGNMPPPSYVGVTFVGHVIDDEVYDFTIDGNAASSLLIFEFFDDTINLMCDVIYDASGAIPATGWTTDSGASLWAAFDVPLSGGNSTCGAVSVGIYTDMRDWIEDRSWGFGLGEMILLEADLSAAVNAGGGNWGTDWAPYTYALYVTGGPFGASNSAVEASWAQSLDHACEDVFVDALGYVTPLTAPTGGPLEDFVNSGSFLVYLIE